MKRLLVIAVSTAVLVLTGGGTAFAGEVKGPPGTVNNTNETGALDHAKSTCAASGSNDLDQDRGTERARRFKLPRTHGSTTGCRRVPQARSDSAKAAELARVRLVLAPAFGRGQPLLNTGAGSIYRLAYSCPGKPCGYSTGACMHLGSEPFVAFDGCLTARQAHGTARHPGAAASRS